ncbi:hypothetical protein UFOVP708_54 [uncultured Caudovirales phage]|uniref:Uncharacterized protein n=1 Tax=uncultured Caudovirales phage TaxID=2100421 RepID=A0A6J5NII6_9CAUD|nr:hypothetical protein UFOVP708_54 [uncultured Caudovirales phage]
MSDTNDIKERLRTSLRTVPKGVVYGSWQSAVSFKDFVARANKALANPRATAQQLNTLLNTYQTFTK